MGEGWARAGLITSFSLYLSHVGNFTSKIKENYIGFKSAGKLFMRF
jgi:hypothetical protein